MRRTLTILGLAALTSGCGLILGLQEPTVNDSIGDAQGSDADGGGNPQDVIQGDTPIDSTCGANLQTDGKNCGNCGHDCLGGTCSGGVCQPVLVTQSTALAPYAMVLSGTTLYFTNIRGTAIATVFSVDKTAVNGTANELNDYMNGYTSPEMDGFPYGLAVQGTTFYTALYSNTGGAVWYGGVDSCATAGGCTKKTITQYGFNSYAVAANATSTFFGKTDINDVYTLQKASLALGSPVTFATPASEINGVVADTNNVFYATGDGVFSCSTTCNATAITQGAGVDAELLALDSNNVYFTSTPFMGTPTVQSVARGGGPPKLISSKPAVPFGVATDGVNIYFTDVGDTTMPTTGAVYVCPVGGCSGAEVLLSTGAAAGDNPRPIISDTNAIYWGTRGGAIWRLAK